MDNIQPDTASSDSPNYKTDVSKETAKQLHETFEYAQDILYSATTVFPFSLFPDTVTIDRQKVTIVNRSFFRVAEIVSIRVEDVLNVTADVGPFLGAVRIQTRFFENDVHSIKFLRRRDALCLKRMLQGYVIASNKDIDCDNLTAEDLIKLLDDIGQGHPSKDM